MNVCFWLSRRISQHHDCIHNSLKRVVSPVHNLTVLSVEGPEFVDEFMTMLENLESSGLHSFFHHLDDGLLWLPPAGVSLVPR